MIDILVNRVIETHDELRARYDLAFFRIHETFAGNRVKVPGRGRAIARDVVFHGLALYEATLIAPGSASNYTPKESLPDNVYYLW